MFISKNKYNNTKVVFNKIEFDSKKEMNRYIVLLNMARIGKITALELQPKFLLEEGFVYNGKKERDINYIADFKYKKGNDLIVEDVKGMKTEVYKIKRKLFLKKYGDSYIFKET